MIADVNRTSRRRYLVFAANVAKTPEQIQTVSEGVASWLRSYPKDEIVKRAARQLEGAEQRLRQAGEWH